MRSFTPGFGHNRPDLLIKSRYSSRHRDEVCFKIISCFCKVQDKLVSSFFSVILFVSLKESANFACDNNEN